jgi:DivIVA domain-containing protein
VIVFFLLIVVLLIGLTAAAVMGRIGGFMAEPTSTHAFSGVMAGSLSADDVKGLHFDQALRGYRMDQVDETIDALAERLRQLEAAAVPLPAAGAPLPATGALLPPSGDSPNDSLGPERE